MISKVTLTNSTGFSACSALCCDFRHVYTPQGSIEAKSPELPISRAECCIITDWPCFKKGVQSHIKPSVLQLGHDTVPACVPTLRHEDTTAWSGLCALLCGVDMPGEKVVKQLLKIVLLELKLHFT